MGVYISLFTFIAVMTIVSLKYNKYSKYANYIIICILVLFSGLRFGIGNDYVIYKSVYNSVASITNLFRLGANYQLFPGIEKTYLFLNSLLRSIGISFELFILICSAAIISFIYKSAQKYTNFVSLALLIYFIRFYFTRDMDQIRNAIACAIILYSFSFIRDNKYKEFSLYTLIALIFHKVAFLNLLILVLYKLIANRRKVYLNLFYISVFIGIFNIVKLVANIITPYLPPNISGYLVHEAFVKGPGLKNPVLIFQVLLIIYFLYYYESFKKKSKYFDILFCSYFISTCWMLIFNNFYSVSGRVSTVFATVEIILIPLVFEKYIHDIAKYIRYASVIILSFYIIGLFGYALSSNVKPRLIPYRTILSEREIKLNVQDKSYVHNIDFRILWSG